MGEMPAKSFVEKLLYSRRDTADALSLSIRSVDYLITAGRLPTRSPRQ